MEKEPKFEIHARMSPEQQKKIVKKFKDMGFSLEVRDNHFVAQIEVDGKETERHFPLWESMDLADGGSVKTEDDIEAFFTFQDPNLSTREGVERLKNERKKK